MRVFMTRGFGRFARRAGISEDILCLSIDRANQGLVDADLGGGVIKQRVPRPGKGRSGGFRTLIAFQSRTRAVFLLGFAKNERGNVDDAELSELRRAAAEILSWSETDISAMVASGAWLEINRDEQI